VWWQQLPAAAGPKLSVTDFFPIVVFRGCCVAMFITRLEKTSMPPETA